MSDTPRVPGGAQVNRSQRPVPVSNEVSLTIGKVIWRGWTAIRIGRGLERFPSDFEVALTERYPGQAGTLLVEPGAACVLKIGNDVILTGWVDRYTAGVGPKGHEVRIHGRSRCSDLVDCSAGVLPDRTWRSLFQNMTILALCQQLAEPFGVKVTSQADEASKIIPNILLNLGETPAEVMDRVCRWAGLLYYDTPDGNMVLARVGTESMASALVEGVNVEQAQAQFTADQRFSRYIVLTMSTDAYFQIREGSDGSTDGNVQVVINDPSNPALRYRPHIIITEQVNADNTFAMIRGVWEMNRRNGRSRQVTVTTDTWRDSANRLWEPNRLVSVDIPLLKIRNQRWLIGEVTYRLDEGGTHCDLTLMPPDAYSVEPFNLQPVARQVLDALKGGAQKPEGSSRGLNSQSDTYTPGAVPRGDT